MPARIKDRFSDLPISRQVRYQLRMEAAKRCRQCGGKLAKLKFKNGTERTSFYCDACLDDNCARQKKKYQKK